MKKATQQQTKEHNRNLVLKTLFEHDCISRAEIARITSLTRTTVSDIIADLIEEGLIREVGYGSSQGGKSPILLSLVEDSRCLIGLDLAQNQFCGSIVSLRGNIRKSIKLPANGLGGDEALAMLYKILDQLVEAANQHIVGISVGTAGLVNTSEGVVVNAVNLNWTNLPLGHLLSDRYHLPVYVLNDSQAAAMGEYTYGKDHRSDDHLVVINAGHGIGAGIVVNSHLFQGDGSGAGEIGHVVVVPAGGLPCRCGHYGCLETVASARALVNQALLLVSQFTGSLLSQTHEEITLDAIEQAFHADDPLARQVVFDNSRYLGLAISNLVGTLNIRKIVLVGEMTRFGQPWLEVIQQTMRQMSLEKLAQDTQVEIGQLGRDSIILGAAAMLANDYSLLFNR